MTSPELVAVAAEVLGLATTDLAGPAEHQSFAMLGGSSLQAIELVAAGASRGWDVPLAGLVSRTPLAETLAAAGPARAPHSPVLDQGHVRDALPGQAGMLRWDERGAGFPYYLLFTAEIHGGADLDRIDGAVRRLVDRHEALRTYFVQSEKDSSAIGRRVLPAARPQIYRQVLRAAPGQAVEEVHRQLGAASTTLLDAFAGPPVYFLLTETGGAPMLSMLCHHALLDGWAVGRLFAELTADLAGEPLPPAPSAEQLVLVHQRLRESGEFDRVCDARVAELAGAATTLELPSDLPRPAQQRLTGARLTGRLSLAALDAWQEIARAAGVSRSVVVLAAYAAVLARRAGVPELLVGMPVAGRHRPEVRDLVASAVQMVPVRCRVSDEYTVVEYVQDIADELSAAVRAADVPFEELVERLGVAHDVRRAPLVQAVLAPNDEVVARRITAGSTTVDIHEGHCGGAPFDLVLYVRGDAAEPELVCEYATSVSTPPEAAELLDALDTALIEFAGGLNGQLSSVRTISAAQRSRLAAIRTGPPSPVLPDTDLWQSVAAVAARAPETLAVREGDPERALTYRQVIEAAESLAAVLARAGVGDGDIVALAVPRSVEEVVSMLAVLRLGATYMGLDTSDPDRRLGDIFGISTPRAVLTVPETAARLSGLVPEGCACLDVLAPAGGLSGLPPAPQPDPERIVYVTFTSGSTGVPKGVRVRHRSVLRLVSADLGAGAICVPGDRMLRISPLAFDLSPIEVFGPLVVGGSVEVHPEPLPTAAGVARFLVEREITVAWITAGLFRLVAEYEPDSFRGLRRVMAGGEAVDPDAVRAVLRHCPGVQVVNGYGPSENTTFTTTYPADNPSDVDFQTPIGTAVPGTGLLILDGAGLPVPPGGIGELCATGEGLAVDYLGNDEATAAGFGRPAPDTGERAYRTGDLVRLDGAGRLRYLGRDDYQVKIGGVRIELGETKERLLSYPGISAAVVVAVRRRTSNAVLAAVVTDHAGGGPAEWRDRLAKEVPAHAVPSLWAVVAEIPLTANGKTDTAALEQVANPIGAMSAQDTAGPEQAPADPGSAAWIAAAAWESALGRLPRTEESNFFNEGGNSLKMGRLIVWLRRQHGIRLEPRQFYETPTPRWIADRVAAARSDS